VLRDGTDANDFFGGHILVSLTAICIAVFTTAAMIIRQLTRTFSPAWKIILPGGAGAQCIWRGRTMGVDAVGPADGGGGRQVGQRRSFAAGGSVSAAEYALIAIATAPA
jgi:hypothetical protein